MTMSGVMFTTTLPSSNTLIFTLTTWIGDQQLLLTQIKRWFASHRARYRGIFSLCSFLGVSDGSSVHPDQEHRRTYLQLAGSSRSTMVSVPSGATISCSSTGTSPRLEWIDCQIKSMMMISFVPGEGIQHVVLPSQDVCVRSAHNMLALGHFLFDLCTGQLDVLTHV